MGEDVYSYTIGLYGPVVNSKSSNSSKRGNKMFTLWTLYQALKLLERHAIFNQKCKNWVGVNITGGLIMGFQKQSGGGGGTSAHPLVLTFKFYTCPRPKQWQWRWQQQEQFCHVCFLWLTGRFWCHTAKVLGLVHLLPRIDQIHAGTKHLHQLFLII